MGGQASSNQGKCNGRTSQLQCKADKPAHARGQLSGCVTIVRLTGLSVNDSFVIWIVLVNWTVHVSFPNLSVSTAVLVQHLPARLNVLIGICVIVPPTIMPVDCGDLPLHSRPSGGQAMRTLWRHLGRLALTSASARDVQGCGANTNRRPLPAQCLQGGQASSCKADKPTLCPLL